MGAKVSSAKKSNHDLELLRLRVRELERELKRVRKEAVTIEEARRAIFRVRDQTPSRVTPWEITARSGSSGEGTLTLAISDIHYGETVDGVTGYTSEVARRRFKRVIENAIHVAKEHAPKHTDKMVVALLGDLVSGEIHDELIRYNDSSLMEQVVDMADLLASGLDLLQRELKVPLYVPCVAGNHGRTTRKLEAKRFAPTNADWLVYRVTERLLKASNRREILMDIPDTNEAKWIVYNHRYMALHGHDLGVRGGDGMIGPLGPIMRGRYKVVAQQRSMGWDVDTLVIGHFHQYITLPGLICNGSIKGFDEYAAKVLRAPFSPPMQAMWYTCPQRGITSHWPVFAE